MRKLSWVIILLLIIVVILIIYTCILFFTKDKIPEKYFKLGTEYFDNNSPIPKIIHQTWKTKYLPIHFQDWSKTIKNFNPNWKYKLWTDEDNRNFIKNYYPDFLKIYDNYDKNIKRVDAVRYFYLYHYGGAYIDMDMIALKSLDELVNNCPNCCIFSYEDVEKKSIPNAFMVAPPKHPLFGKLINNLWKTRNISDVLECTGPRFLTKVIEEYQGKDIKIYNVDQIFGESWNKKSEKLNECKRNLDLCKNLFPNSYFITFWTATWHEKDQLMYRIPSFVKSNGINLHQKIPQKQCKILIRDNNDDDVNEIIFKSVESWINLNPEYEFHFLNEDRCENFLKKHFDNLVLETFQKLKPYAYKCDLVRLCWLFINGGVYSDVRTTLLKPLREIISSDSEFIIAKDKEYEGDTMLLCNAFICSVPHHPFLKICIDQICSNVSGDFYGTNPLQITGPVMVGNTILRLLNPTSELILKDKEYNLGKFTNNGYNFEIIDFTGKSFDQNRKEIILYKKGRDKITTIIKNTNVYWIMWQQKDIYKSSILIDIEKKIINKKSKNIDIPSIYINLERSKKRNQNMMKQLEQNSIAPYERLNAIDGKYIQNLKKGKIDIINFVNSYPLTKYELACTLSHLKAIKYFYESGFDMGLIIEDDCNIDLSRLWNESLSSILQKNIIEDWGIIRLGFIGDCIKLNSNKIKFINQKFTPICASTSAYVISRKGMNDILSKCYRNDIFYIQEISRGYPKYGVADEFIYDLTDTYISNFPLLVPSITGSTIHNDHEDYQRKEIMKIMNFYHTSF